MDQETLREMYLLRMRAACCDMEFGIQCAAKETRLGGWQQDWKAHHAQAQNEFNEAEALLRINCSN